MTPTTNTITRKEIAAAADVSVQTVTRQESQWGLAPCRSKARKIPVCYFRDRANEILLKAGVISRPI